MSNGQTKELVLVKSCGSAKGDSTYRPIPCFCYPPPPPQPPPIKPPPAPSSISIGIYEHQIYGAAYGTPYEFVEGVGGFTSIYGSSNPGVPNGGSSYGPVLLVHAYYNSPWDITPSGFELDTPFWLTYVTSITVQGYPLSAGQMPQNAQVDSSSLVDPATGQPLTGAALTAAGTAAAVQGMNAAIQNAYTAMGWDPKLAPVYTASTP